MTDVDIGALRSLLSLQAPVRTADGGGGADVAWSELARVWAAVRPWRGSERVVADRIAGSVTHEIHIRWRAGILPSMRFVEAARVFEIRAVMDVNERRRWLRCLCEEREL